MNTARFADIAKPLTQLTEGSDPFVVFRSRRFIPVHEELVYAAILGYLGMVMI
jgi:hypothetical protein